MTSQNKSNTTNGSSQKHNFSSEPAPLILCSHVNLHKKSECNADVLLFADYAMRNYHINEHDVALGLETFNPDFNYNNSERDNSIPRGRKCGNDDTPTDTSMGLDATPPGTPSFSNTASTGTTISPVSVGQSASCLISGTPSFNTTSSSAADPAACTPSFGSQTGLSSNMPISKGQALLAGLRLRPFVILYCLYRNYVR